MKVDQIGFWSEIKLEIIKKYASGRPFEKVAHEPMEVRKGQALHGEEKT